MPMELKKSVIYDETRRQVVEEERRIYSKIGLNGHSQMRRKIVSLEKSIQSWHRSLVLSRRS
jgi:hypothetical protein